MKYLTFILVTGLLACGGAESKVSSDDVMYRFFVAGHAYGHPDDHEPGLHPPLVEAFSFLKDQDKLSFGVFTGDIVPMSTKAHWEKAQEQIESLGVPTYKVYGNHEHADRNIAKEFVGESDEAFRVGSQLFLKFDVTKTGWRMVKPQHSMLDKAVNVKDHGITDVFMFMHQMVWWDENNSFKNYPPNSLMGRSRQANFWTEYWPKVEWVSNMGINIWLIAGDAGANKQTKGISYGRRGNIHFINSGMGGGHEDNILLFNVKKDGSIVPELISLPISDLHKMGDLEDYLIKAQ